MDELADIILKKCAVTEDGEILFTPAVCAEEVINWLTKRLQEDDVVDAVNKAISKECRGSDVAWEQDMVATEAAIAAMLAKVGV